MKHLLHDKEGGVTTKQEGFQAVAIPLTGKGASEKKDMEPLQDNKTQESSAQVYTSHMDDETEEQQDLNDQQSDEDEFYYTRSDDSSEATDDDKRKNNIYHLSKQ